MDAKAQATRELVLLAKIRNETESPSTGHEENEDVAVDLLN